MVFINIQNVYSFPFLFLVNKYVLFSHSHHICVFICWLTWLMAHIFIKSLTPIVIHNNFCKWCAQVYINEDSRTLRFQHCQQHKAVCLVILMVRWSFLAHFTKQKKKPSDLLEEGTYIFCHLQVIITLSYVNVNINIGDGKKKIMSSRGKHTAVVKLVHNSSMI